MPMFRKKHIQSLHTLFVQPPQHVDSTLDTYTLRFACLHAAILGATDKLWLYLSHDEFIQQQIRVSRDFQWSFRSLHWGMSHFASLPDPTHKANAQVGYLALKFQHLKEQARLDIENMLRLYTENSCSVHNIWQRLCILDDQNFVLFSMRLLLIEVRKQEHIPIDNRDIEPILTILRLFKETLHSSKSNIELSKYISSDTMGFWMVLLIRTWNNINIQFLFNKGGWNSDLVNTISLYTHHLSPTQVDTIVQQVLCWSKQMTDDTYHMRSYIDSCMMKELVKVQRMDQAILIASQVNNEIYTATTWTHIVQHISNKEQLLSAISAIQQSRTEHITNEVWAAIALNLVTLGCIEEAWTTIQQHIAAEETRIPLLVEIGTELAKQGKFTEAVALTEQTNGHASAMLLSKIAPHQYRQGEHQASKALLQQALETTSDLDDFTRVFAVIHILAALKEITIIQPNENNNLQAILNYTIQLLDHMNVFFLEFVLPGVILELAKLGFIEDIKSLVLKFPDVDLQDSLVDLIQLCLDNQCVQPALLYLQHIQGTATKGKGALLIAQYIGRHPISVKKKDEYLQQLFTHRPIEDLILVKIYIYLSKFDEAMLLINQLDESERLEVLFLMLHQSLNIKDKTTATVCQEQIVSLLRSKQIRHRSSQLGTSGAVLFQSIHLDVTLNLTIDSLHHSVDNREDLEHMYQFCAEHDIINFFSSSILQTLEESTQKGSRNQALLSLVQILSQQRNIDSAKRLVEMMNDATDFEKQTKIMASLELAKHFIQQHDATAMVWLAKCSDALPQIEILYTRVCVAIEVGCVMRDNDLSIQQSYTILAQVMEWIPQIKALQHIHKSLMLLSERVWALQEKYTDTQFKQLSQSLWKQICTWYQNLKVSTPTIQYLIECISRHQQVGHTSELQTLTDVLKNWIQNEPNHYKRLEFQANCIPIWGVLFPQTTMDSVLKECHECLNSLTDAGQQSTICSAVFQHYVSIGDWQLADEIIDRIKDSDCYDQAVERVLTEITPQLDARIDYWYRWFTRVSNPQSKVRICSTVLKNCVAYSKTHHALHQFLLDKSQSKYFSSLFIRNHLYQISSLRDILWLFLYNPFGDYKVEELIARLLYIHIQEDNYVALKQIQEITPIWNIDLIEQASL